MTIVIRKTKRNKTNDNNNGSVDKLLLVLPVSSRHDADDVFSYSTFFELLSKVVFVIILLITRIGQQSSIPSHQMVFVSLSVANAFPIIVTNHHRRQRKNYYSYSHDSSSFHYYLNNVRRQQQDEFRSSTNILRQQQQAATTSSSDDDDNNRDVQQNPKNMSSSNHQSNCQRRDFLVQVSSTVASSFVIQGFPVSTFADDTTSTTTTSSSGTSTSRTIVITGANSGIGLEACKRLSSEKDTTIILACRTLKKAEKAIETIMTTTTNTIPVLATLIPAECDLTNVQSIQQFVDGLSNNNNLDVVCYNAGISRNINSKECLRTMDGFELTIGTNHFGHFYLNHLLLPKINKDTGKIVITASAVHDPNSPGGAQGELASLGNLQGLEKQGKDCEMIDGQSFNADKAYKDSKLCNVLFTRELQRRLNAAGSNIIANSFTPGLIVGTGLFRDQNPIFTKLFDFAATDLLKVGEIPQWGGAALTYMINDVTTKGEYYYSAPGTSAKYGESAFGNLNLFGPTQVSIEAQDNAKAKRLWELSEKVLGIKTSI